MSTNHYISEIEGLTKRVVEIGKENDKLKAENKKLKKYTQHDINCDDNINCESAEQWECTCGLNELLKGE